MRKNGLLVAVVLAALVAATVALAGCITVNTAPKADTAQPATTPEPAATPSPGGFTVGQSVASPWQGGDLYLAKVTAIEDDQVTVQYADDNSTRSISAADIKPIPLKTWAVGDRVLAVWASGRFYSGEITKVVGSSYTVTWDDGSTPSEVTPDKIIAQ